MVRNGFRPSTVCVACVCLCYSLLTDAGANRAHGDVSPFAWVVKVADVLICFDLCVANIFKVAEVWGALVVSMTFHIV